MHKINRSQMTWILRAGDLPTLFTVFGFAWHSENEIAGRRILTAYLPLVISWLLIAPIQGAFDLSNVSHPFQLWRPFSALAIAGSLAALLRALKHNKLIQSDFVMILSGISALALLAWGALIWDVVLRKV